MNNPSLKPALHFVGFRLDTELQQFVSAVRLFGEPDFVHRTYDVRSTADMVPGFDTVIFAQYENRQPCPFAFDDSNQPDDPAATERKQV